MGRNISEISNVTNEMDLELLLNQAVLGMKENGKMIKEMAREGIY